MFCFPRDRKVLQATARKFSKIHGKTKPEQVDENSCVCLPSLQASSKSCNCLHKLHYGWFGNLTFHRKWWNCVMLGDLMSFICFTFTAYHS